MGLGLTIQKRCPKLGSEIEWTARIGNLEKAIGANMNLLILRMASRIALELGANGIQGLVAYL